MSVATAAPAGVEREDASEAPALVVEGLTVEVAPGRRVACHLYPAAAVTGTA